MNDEKRNKDRVYSKWVTKPETERTAQHREVFVDELWGSGLRLSKSPNIHYQMVMDIIRRL